MARLHGGSSARRKGAFRKVVKRASARHNKAKLPEWLKMYCDTVVPLLPSTVALPLEVALRTVEYANFNTPLGQTDWGALARGAYNWRTGPQKGGLVSLHLYGPCHDPRMRRMQNRYLQAYVRSLRGARQRGGMAGAILTDLTKKRRR